MKNLHADPRENAPESTPPTQEELKLIHHHRIKAQADRQTMSDLNLLRTMKLGEALHKLKD
ncbi:hypothetical protein [Zoogloea sp. 1C4]|uniref:hypothetical protein n=1 Tax=Zoogloea sp. 1C4 TaxID=2570190 RepID=UPI001291F1EC|nr:hypothetical protein [Zoogloea sp. 1C4]